MSKATLLIKLLEQFNDFASTPSEDEILLRANHRSGVRCLDCGRLLSSFDKFPSVRSCPNKECNTKYHIGRSNRRLLLRKIS